MLDSEPVQVAAYSLPPEQKEPAGENNLAATIRFADGSVATLAYSTVGSKTSNGERVEIFGQGFGVMTEDFKRLRIARGMRRESSKIWPDKGYGSQMQSFVQCIRDGKPQEISALDGARASLVCVRIMESCRTGLPLAIDMDSLKQYA